MSGSVVISTNKFKLTLLVEVTLEILINYFLPILGSIGFLVSLLISYEEDFVELFIEVDIDLKVKEFLKNLICNINLL